MGYLDSYAIKTHFKPRNIVCKVKKKNLIINILTLITNLAMYSVTSIKITFK